MPRYSAMAVTVLLTCSICLAAEQPDAKDGWIRLFNGKNLDGWRASENPDTFAVRDGAIVVNGPRAHLFYVGDVEQHDFRNFEFKADVRTTAGSNSGLYFHTRFQQRGFPRRGYEVQVNHSHGDRIKSASLYNIQNITKSPVKDDAWFTQEIVVRGKRIITKVNGKTLVDYTEPDDVPSSRGRRISSGTFAIQGHDPGSKVYVRNIMVRPLPN